MLIGDINLVIPGAEEVYSRFINAYGSTINNLVTKHFNKEDVYSKSDVSFSIHQYIYAYILTLMIKQDYELGFNNITIPSIDIDKLYTKLRNNNIDLKELFTVLGVCEKVFNLEVVDGEVTETVANREVDEDESTISTLSVGIEDNLPVIIPDTMGYVYYMDNVSNLELTSESDLDITVHCIVKADDDIITSYRTNDYNITLERVGTSLVLFISDQTTTKRYTIGGVHPTSSWIFGFINIKIANSLIVVNSFFNGSFYKGSPTDVPPSIVSTPTPRYFIGDNSTGNNKYYKISWFRGQPTEDFILKQYIYYKNLISI
jgi:hypothetical protein